MHLRSWRRHFKSWFHQEISIQQVKSICIVLLCLAYSDNHERRELGLRLSILKVGIVVLLLMVRLLFAVLVVALSSVAAAIGAEALYLLLACTAAECNAARNSCAELELAYDFERCGGGLHHLPRSQNRIRRELD